MELEEVEQSKGSRGPGLGSGGVACLPPTRGTLRMRGGETGGQIVGEQGKLHKF